MRRLARYSLQVSAFVGLILLGLCFFAAAAVTSGLGKVLVVGVLIGCVAVVGVVFPALFIFDDTWPTRIAFAISSSWGLLFMMSWYMMPNQHVFLNRLVGPYVAATILAWCCIRLPMLKQA